ncbi:MAG: (Fe-S)-binding protein [Bilophila wadsworthia]
MNEKLSRCSSPARCQANCPSGVKTTDIFLRRGPSWRPIWALGHQIGRIPDAAPNPRLFGTLLRLTRVPEPHPQDEAKPQNTVCAPLLKPMLGDRHMPKLAAKPLHSTVGNVNTPMGKSRIQVAFFPGCLGDKIYTNVSEACLKVFDYHEIGVFLSDNYACCGMPALASGDRQGFEKMVMHNVDILKDQNYDYIVTPCSSCTVAIREFWAQFSDNLPPRYRDAINALAPKAIDINALLVDVLHVSPKTQAKGQTKVTYHESCHLQKSLGVSKQPRDLIRMNPGYNLVEMAEANRCCGCGGSFTLTHYDLFSRWARESATT